MPGEGRVELQIQGRVFRVQLYSLEKSIRPYSVKVVEGYIL